MNVRLGALVLLVAALSAAALTPLARAAEDSASAPKHPVAVRFETFVDEMENWMSNDWGLDRSIDEIALSTEAAVPGAREALQAELAQHKYLAAAVLWRMDPAGTDLHPLLEVIVRPRAEGDDPQADPDEAVYVVRYARFRPALPFLWRRIALRRREPFVVAAAASAIYAIDRSPKALQILQDIVRSDEARFRHADDPPQSIAEDYLRVLQEGTTERIYVAVPPPHPALEILFQTELDVTFHSLPEPNWSVSSERILRELAESPEMTMPGAREVLRGELEYDRYYAAVPLWVVYHDETAVDKLLSRLERPSPDAQLPSEDAELISFILGYLRVPQAVPALWNKIEADDDLYVRLYAARAIHRIARDAESIALIKKLPAKASAGPGRSEFAASVASVLADLDADDRSPVAPAPAPGDDQVRRRLKKAEPLPYGNAKELACDGLTESSLGDFTRSAVARRPAAVPVLREEMRRGSLAAAAALWQVEHDTTAVAALLAELSRPSVPGRDRLAVPIVLGVMKAPQALAPLREAIRRSDADPVFQLCCASAAHLTQDDSESMEFIRGLAANPRAGPGHSSAEVGKIAATMLEQLTRGDQQKAEADRWKAAASR